MADRSILKVAVYRAARYQRRRGRLVATAGIVFALLVAVLALALDAWPLYVSAVIGVVLSARFLHRMQRYARRNEAFAKTLDAAG